MKGLTVSQKDERRASVMNMVLGGQLRVKEAAACLELTERQAWRVLAAYRQAGIRGLVHGNRGRKPARAVGEDVKGQVLKLAEGSYEGANDTHFTELLDRHESIRLSRSTVRRILRGAGKKSPQHRRAPKHRSRRERCPREGMLLQVDGCRHRWLGDGGPVWVLIGGIDDAKGTVPWGVFREQEDAHGYLLLLEGVLRREGIPAALYADRHSIFHRSADERETIEEQLAGKREPTQFGRALEELGIQLILAHSPQAKGRIERLWKTLQDRLVFELHRAGVTTLEEANRFLPGYLKEFNAQFAVPAAEEETAYRPVPTGLDLQGVLCFKYTRTVSGDNTISFAGRTLQLHPTPTRASFAHAKVEVRERLDGRIVVAYQGQVLLTTDAPPTPVVLRARTGPRAAGSKPEHRLAGGVRAVPGPKGMGAGERGSDAEGARRQAGKAHKPGPNHPWRTWL